MVAYAKYNWLTVILFGVINIITLFVPVALADGDFSIWLWGLVYDGVFLDRLSLIENIITLSIGITSAILICIISLKSIVIGNSYRRNYIDDKKIGRLCIIYGSIIIVSIIVPIISLSNYTYHGYFPDGIWDVLFPSVGLAGPLGGGLLELALGIVFLKSSRIKNQD